MGKEREAASQVLHYLGEVEERKLFLKHASSLFEFCIKVHNYSRYEAQARIDAMRLMKTAPEISQDIDGGRLSLTVAAQLQSAFRKENVRRKAAGEKPLSKVEQKTVIEDVKSASTRDADRKLAAHEIERLDAPPRRAPGIKTASKSRYIRKETHQQVWADWEQGCAFTLENGERCGSRQNLQRDHVLQFAEGGGSELKNLRLLCGAHKIQFM